MGERREGDKGEKGMKKKGRGRRKMVGWNNKIFWEELASSLPLMRHGPHRKRSVQKLFYCYQCIRCRENVFIEPLPGNDRGIHREEVIS
jgi:hypothetical protein